jgi:hypothetical protein
MCNKWFSLWADNYLAEFRISISLLVYGTIITSGSGDGHLNVFFFAARLRLYPSRGKP